MSIFRTTFQFKSSQGGTWNEVFYVDATTPASAANLGPKLVQARLQMLDPSNTFIGTRAAQVGASRKTSLVNFNLSGTFIPGSVQPGPDTVGSAAVMNIAGTTGGTRKLWMRGLPDYYIQHDPVSGADKPPSSFLNAIAQYMGYLADNGFGLLQVTPQGTIPYNNVQITSVDGSAKDGTSIITLAVATTYIFPGQVIIGGCSAKELPALNGRFSIINQIDATHIRVPYATSQGNIIPGGKGHVRQLTYMPVNVINPNASGFAYYSTRVTKNGSTHTRGARRAQRIRQLS